MKRFLLVALWAALTVLAVVLVQGERANRNLRLAIAAERRVGSALDELRRENQRLAAAAAGRGDVVRAEHDELVRLRARIEMARTEPERAATRTAPVTTPASDPPRLPVSAPPWQNKGRATPAGAFETGNWAQWNGNLDTMMTTFVFEGESKRRLDALFAAQPEEDRARYGSAERMAAMLALDATTGLTGAPLPMQIIERSQDSDHAEVVLRVHLPDGTDRDRAVPARLFSDGWKIVLPTEQVDMLENSLSSFPPTQRLMTRR